jgi:hypothetical protein
MGFPMRDKTTAPKLKLLPDLEKPPVRPGGRKRARWLTSEFSGWKTNAAGEAVYSHKGLPIDELHDAMVMFDEIYGDDPDTLYLHPDTYFWLSFIWSNFDLEGDPEPEPVWFWLDELHSVASVKIEQATCVPRGWWHIVKTAGPKRDLRCWADT